MSALASWTFTPQERSAGRAAARIQLAEWGLQDACDKVVRFELPVPALVHA
ncbi:hypothetical protein ACIBQ1_43980 [Nonomuraea sp. NPDC050153]|uniref:hypothetical protein n=1 Tax=Nonomuraea sp. NPDC050153 TaxID=3364359 RepID=UPI0037A3430F